MSYNAWDKQNGSLLSKIHEYTEHLLQTTTPK